MFNWLSKREKAFAVIAMIAAALASTATALVTFTDLFGRLSGDSPTNGETVGGAQQTKPPVEDPPEDGSSTVQPIPEDRPPPEPPAPKVEAELHWNAFNSGAMIYIDGRPAEVLDQTALSATIKAPKGAGRVELRRGDETVCETQVYISNGSEIYPCAQ